MRVVYLLSVTASKKESRHGVRCSVLGLSTALSRCEIVFVLIAASSLLLIVIEICIHVGCDGSRAVMMRECV